MITFAEELQEARKRLKINQDEAAKRAGAKLRTYQGWERGENEPAVSVADEVRRRLGIAGDTLPLVDVSEPARDPIYDVIASAGDGGVVVREDPIGYITGPDAMSRPGRRIGWVTVHGDSMGELYRRGMMVPVHFFDEPPKDVHEDDVYLFRLEHAIQLKRLQRLPGQRLRVISDNPRYVPVDIEITESTDFEILGRVLS